MSFEWVRESARDAEYTSGKDGETRATRSWIALASAPGTTPKDAVAQCPVEVGNSYPGARLLQCKRVRARPTDATGMLWTITAEYEVDVPEDEEQEDPQGGRVPGKPDIWGGGSSVASQPIYEDRDFAVITNTAGDPLEDLTADVAEFRLTLTTYRRSHTDWLPLAREYTNTINNGNWNGAVKAKWKCQGCSAKLQIEERDGEPLVYWEVTFEFAYNENQWYLEPWNIGFHELVDEDGNPDPYGGKRAVIKTSSGRGVRHPVALKPDGTAKPPGEKPDTLVIAVYKEKDFRVFGEISTPGGA